MVTINISSSEEPTDEWYSLVGESDILQGDIVTDFWSIHPIVPVGGRPFDAGQPEADPQIEWEYFPRVVVVSQSCDLVASADELDAGRFALVCPVATVAELREDETPKLQDKWNNARAGRLPNYHALGPSTISGYGLDYALVSFERVIEIRLDHLRTLLSEKPHLRLNSPYREALGQALARLFMRVGLPQTLPAYRDLPSSSSTSFTAGSPAYRT